MFELIRHVSRGLWRARPRGGPAKSGLVGMAALLFSLGVTAGADGAGLRTVVGGLDNPRGLAFLRDGQLVVADGGHAGPLCFGPGQCGGLTGQVISVDLRSARRTTLAAGLPSIGGPFGPFGLGGLAVQRGRLYAIVGLNPQASGTPAGNCQGQPRFAACVATMTKVVGDVGNLDEVKSLRANHGWRTVAGVGRFDFHYAVTHPDPGNSDYNPGDADPFGLLAGPSGGFYVVDGASNTFGFVNARGRISVLAFVPDPPGHQPIYDAAPTCAARTPDGALVIGTESGSVWRWKAHHLTRLLIGGKVGQVVACVADAHGNVFLANLDARIRGLIGNPLTGSIVKVTPGLRTSYVARGLNYPTGMTWGPDGNLYITVNGLCPADLSLLNSQNAPPGACPASGRVVRLNGLGG